MVIELSRLVKQLSQPQAFQAGQKFSGDKQMMKQTKSQTGRSVARHNCSFYCIVCREQYRECLGKVGTCDDISGRPSGSTAQNLNHNSNTLTGHSSRHNPDINKIWLSTVHWPAHRIFNLQRKLCCVCFFWSHKNSHYLGCNGSANGFDIIASSHLNTATLIDVLYI